MALKFLTQKTATQDLKDDAHIVITQTEEVGDTEKPAVRRIPFANFAASLGADLDFDEDSQTLFLVNPDGLRVGQGTPVLAGITGLQMYTETDESGTQYLILTDDKGAEICRTEFVISGGGGGDAVYTCRLINKMPGLKVSFPGGQPCMIDYAFEEYFGSDQTEVSATCEVFTKTATTDYVLRKTETISQGDNSIDITAFIQEGTNYVKLQVTGGESGMVKVLVYTVNVVDISLTSTFDASKAYSSAISFMYRVTGRGVGKTMHFMIDDGAAWTKDIGTAHNVQLTEAINLAQYGHGDHELRCWFTTEDGAVSPSLVYDIMYDTGDSEPIISSVLDIDEVDYGDLIQIHYAVFTHGSDYTSVVDLDVYTKDAGNNKVYYSRQALANVVNEAVHTWNVADYPEADTIYLEITAGTAVKTFQLAVNENTGGRDISGVTTRLIAAYNASGRSNSDVNRSAMDTTYTSIDDIETVIRGSLSGFNWRSNGWLSDKGGFPVLRISGGAEAVLDFQFFAAGWVDEDSQTINLAGTPTGAGRTFEVTFATDGVTDEDEEIITVWDETSQIGIKVFPSKAYLLSDSMSVTEDADGNIINKNAIPYVPFSSAGKVRLTFVIEEYGHYIEVEDEGREKQLVKVYVDGQLTKVVAYTTDSFTTSLAKPNLTSGSCILDIYSMRFYDYALSDSDVLKNYIADLPAVSDRIREYDKNNIVGDDGKISLDLARPKYPCMVLTGVLSAYKGDKVKVGVLLYKPDSESAEEYMTVWEFMDKDFGGNYGNVNNVQGTSSQYYLKKNYKITFYRWNDAQAKFVKAKVAIFDGRIPVSTICVKADYMSPDSANTGNANYFQSILTEPTPAQEEDPRVQTSIMGYPILMFQRDTESAAPSFIGRYNLNNDKSNAEAFGLEDNNDDGRDTKCQKWEYCDNSEDICNFLTDQLRKLRTDSGGHYYEAWEDALESCYPDQGDLEDEGLRPKTDYIQSMYTWVVQRADFLNASTSSGTGGTYNGVAYDTERELKQAIFKREFPLHFNVHHTLHYFIANEAALLVDNLAKNMFMATYDTGAEELARPNGDPLDINDIIVNGVVDASAIDWENSSFCIWYPTLYDLDSCLGADNNGYDQFPYYKEMWDQYNSGYVVNGHNSLFWRLVYAAYYDELKALYRTFRDTDKTLSPVLYTKAMVDDLTECLPAVAVNKDEQFKYIDAYEGGYWDASQDDWLYTMAYLYLAKGTMASYHRDFISKRFAMLDSKYMSDAYMQDCMTLRINRGVSEPEDLAFDITPFQALYCYTEWGNSGTYIGGKCLEGESIEMKPTAAGTWADIVLAIYGASHIRSLGDLSVLVPSKLLNLSLCENLTELILGSSEEGYENSALDSVADVSYLGMLQKLDVSNCTSLSGTIDLSRCDLIEEVYAAGSAVSAVALPDGGYLKKIYLPGTIAALNILGHSGLTDFSMDGYSNVLRLRVENTPNVPTDEILAARGTGIARLRLVGVDWILTSEAALRALADPSMAGKAIDANGNDVSDGTVYPTVTGTVTINRIQKSLYDELHTRYPDLVITAATKYHVVKFFNEGTLFGTQEVNDGGTATSPGTPVKAATVQNVYSFSGWDRSFADIEADTSINAQFTSSIQQYTLKFWEDSTLTTLLATVNGVGYGQDYEYPDSFPELSGYVFCGWQDADGNTYGYAVQMPADSAEIDGTGTPQDINLYPVWSAVDMPDVSKDFAELTPGERLFAAIAIQDGAATGCTVTYYPDTGTYIIHETASGVDVTIALGDTKTWTLSTGEVIEQQVIGFNHDYSDSGETDLLGVTYAMKDCLADGRPVASGYRHAFDYKFGNGQAIVNDENTHSSITDELLTNSHTASADEVTAGYVDITVLGPTYLDKIVVTHSDATKKTWYFGKEGFYAGTDKTTVSGCSWYKSDNDHSEEFYKIGKMLQSLGLDVVNWQGSVGMSGWGTTAQEWCYLINQDVTFNTFGGIRINATGTDTLNTAARNPFNGTGKARLAFCKDSTSNAQNNNFTEVSEGTVISIPVVAGDVVTVVCYGGSVNWGGWDKSALKAWANGEFAGKIPLGLRSTIVPAFKKTGIGNRSYVIKGALYDLWCLSDAELGGYTTYHPYMDSGSPYPVFTNAASRKKTMGRGGSDYANWWTRDADIGRIDRFVFCSLSGVTSGTVGATLNRGICFGFCSGEA